NKDFSAVRNLALAHATGDWILMLDANETLPPRYLPMLRAFASDPDFDAVSFEQKRFTFNTRRPGFIAQPHLTFPGYVTEHVVRFFRNKRDAKTQKLLIHYSYRVAETVIPSLLEAGARIKASRIPLHHYEIEGKLLATPQLTGELLALQVQDTPQDPKVHFDYANHLISEGKASKEKLTLAIQSLKLAEQHDAQNILNKGMLYYHLGLASFFDGNTTQALFYAQKSLERKSTNFVTLLLLGRLFVLLRDYDHALAVAAQAKDRQIMHPELLNIAGFSLLQKQRHKDALATLAYARKLLVDKKKAGFFDPTLLELVNNNILTALLEIGKDQEAVAYMEEAIKQSPAVPSYYLNLMQLYLRRGNKEDASGLLKKAKKHKLFAPEIEAQFVKRLETLS
ncbi:TPA: glycosyltransferase, partial [Candidatus Woesearchaeota archaeon]|nr:glycosyltransferase [Candidatus Woesearchaeota archaeon]